MNTKLSPPSHPGIIKFHGGLQAYADKLGLLLGAVTRNVTLKLHGQISGDTPVDTGRARASWNVGVGEIDTSVPSPGQYGPPAPPDVSEIDGTKTVFITSSLVYISALENGHSRSRPHGMVAINVAAQQAVVDAATLDAIDEADLA